MVFVRFPFKNGTRCKFYNSPGIDAALLRNYVTSYLKNSNFKLYYNGKEMFEGQGLEEDATVFVTFSLPGGKGGFGSMLRAIGAQIEKTTNREACRDLSGRRLRDINEEQRLRKWLAKETEREAEKVRRRKERIERLKSQPRHNFVDFEYEKEISQLPERIDDALTAGMQKASKRPVEQGEASCSVSSKKKRLWMDEDISGSSDSDSDSPNSTSSKNTNLSDEDQNQSNTSQVQEFDMSESETSRSSDHCEQKPIITGEQNIPEGNNMLMHEAGTSAVGNENTGSIQFLTNVSCSSEESTLACPKLPEVHSSGGVSIQDDQSLDLLSYESVSELQSIGLDRLKSALTARGLKCGGNVSDRAQRLWRVRGLEPHEYPTNLLAKNKK